MVREVAAGGREEGVGDSAEGERGEGEGDKGEGVGRQAVRRSTMRSRARMGLGWGMGFFLEQMVWFVRYADDCTLLSVRIADR